MPEGESSPGGPGGDVPRTAEVVVIGGGVIGLSTAFQLTRHGVRDVVVLERADLGAGATGKSGALVRAHYTNAAETALTRESLRVFRDWEAEVGAGSPGFEATGFLQVVGPDDETHLRANVAAQQAAGIDTRVVTPDDLREIEPLMRTDDITVAAFEARSGFADPVATAYGFASGFVRAGGTLLTHTPVLGVLTERGRVTGVQTAGGTIVTGAVVVAAGPWADRLLTPLGIDLGLVPRRIQVAVFRWPAVVPAGRRHRVVIDTTQRSWFRPEGTASTLIGVERGGRVADPDDHGETADPEYVAVARAALAARFPAFATATMRGGWAGMIMQSPDGHPIIDQIPEVEGLWVMTGDSGTSFKTAPAIGICLAEWITGGSARLADLTPFRSTRFGEGRPWVDEHAYAYSVGDVLTISR